jgi:hypothetical protein
VISVILGDLGDFSADGKKIFFGWKECSGKEVGDLLRLCVVGEILGVCYGSL